MDLLTANDRPGEYPPSWHAATATLLPPFPALEGAVEADACVIGGGYTGLSAALHLAEAGLDVALIEAQRVGWGASGRNGGQVGTGQRQEQAWIERAFGKTRARALWDLAEEAKALVRHLVARHAIACDLRSGIVQAVHKPRLLAASRRYCDLLARDYGYDEMEWLDRAAIADRLGTRAYFGGMLDRGAVHLHPLNYALGLARAAAAAGVRIHERSRATGIEPGAVLTTGGRVRAPFVLLATNGYHGDLVPYLTRRVMPVNTFIIATEPLAPAAMPIRGGVAAADSRFIVNYFRPSPDGRLLFGGGESHGYRFPRDIAGLVRPRMLAIYPQLAGARIDYAWGGTLAITGNRLPAFARLGPGLFSAAGYSGHGVAMATLAGKLMAEAVTGTAERFDLFAGLPQPAFPGGPRLRPALLALAMRWYALRDRL